MPNRYPTEGAALSHEESHLVHEPSAFTQSSRDIHGLPRATSDGPTSPTLPELTTATPSPSGGDHPAMVHTPNTEAKAEGAIPLSSRVELSNRAQVLIDDMNTKRKQDSQLFEDYKKAVDMQVDIL